MAELISDDDAALLKLVILVRNEGFVRLYVVFSEV